MIKKFLAKLVGFREVSRGEEQFKQREAADKANADYHEQLARQNQLDRKLRHQEGEEITIPSEEEITGPSESESKES